MEYIGVCLSQSPSGEEILPFAPGGVVKVAFSSDGSTVLASGDWIGNIKAWKMLSPLTAGEKKAMQAEEEARKMVAQRMAAATESEREAQRQREFEEREREKAKQFQAEMEREKELERSELAAEQQCIVDDGGDLLAGSGAVPVFLGGFGSSTAIRARRPSEFFGVGAMRRPSQFSPPPSSVATPVIKPSSSATTPAPLPAHTPAKIGWLDDEKEENDAKEKVSKQQQKNKKAIKSNTETDDKKLPALTPAKGGPPPLVRGKSKVNLTSTPKPPTSYPAINSSSKSGAMTARTPLTTNPRPSIPSGSSTARAERRKARVNLDDTPLHSTAPTGSDRRKTGRFNISNKNDDDDQAFTLPSPSSSNRRKTGRFNSPSNNDDSFSTPRTKLNQKDEESSASRRTGTLIRRRRADSDDDDATPSGSPRSSPGVSFSPSPVPDSDNRRSLRATVNRRGGGDLSPSIKSPSSSSTFDRDSFAIIAPFVYSDFDHSTLSHKLRLPSKLKPHLARILPPTDLFANTQAQSGGLWALSQDETIVASFRVHEDDRERTPCKKLVFLDRVKGKTTTCEKSHATQGCSVTMTDDGRKAIVGTRGGHVYLHSIDSTKWTYLWFKLKESDDPVPNLDLAFSPNGLAVLNSRLDKNNALSVWNWKTQKVLSLLDGVSSLSASASPQGHPSTYIKAVWSPDSENICSVGWGLEDRTVRIWKNVMRSMHPRSLSLGRLNTPYTYFRSAPDFFSHALAIAPNGKLLAVAVGLTLFLFNVEKAKCLQYVTLWDLMSKAEEEMDEHLSNIWSDPYALSLSQLTPANVVTAHTNLQTLVYPPDESMALIVGSNNSPQPPSQLTRQGSVARSSAAASPPTLNKKSSLVGMGMNLAVPNGSNSTSNSPNGISKRASIGRDGQYLAGLQLNKRASLNRDQPTLNKRASLQRGQQLTAPQPASESTRSSFAIQYPEGSLTAPASHLTPFLTHITSIAFNPASNALVIGTSLGAVVVLEISRNVARGEEERESHDGLLAPARKMAQKAATRARAEEDAKFALHNVARIKAAEEAEKVRAVQRAQALERKQEREARRLAREEARRLKLYVGSLPDLSWTPAPPKPIEIQPFNRELHVRDLEKAVEEKGEFLDRLNLDLEARQLRAEEREKAKADAEAALLAPALKLHGSNLPVTQVKRRHMSFMDRLNKDLNKRKDFRVTADAGEYYRKNSIIPQKTTSLPAINNK